MARHDVLTIQETGRAEQAVPDKKAPFFASAEERAVLTLNRRHFIYLHRTQPEHAGIIVCTFDPDFVAQAMRIHRVIGAKKTLSRELIRVNRPSLQNKDVGAF